MPLRGNGPVAALIRGLDSVVPAVPHQRFGVVLLTNGDNGLKVCERILTDVVEGDYPVFSMLHVPTLGLGDQPDE